MFEGITVRELRKQFAPDSLSDTGERDMTIVGDGGGVVKWNYNDAASVAKAEAKFKEAIGNGYQAFTTGKSGGKTTEFNPMETLTLVKPIQAG